jgi:uncharacterized glyoxalase superfamily protein PhnB
LALNPSFRRTAFSTAGAQSSEAPLNTPYGDRRGMVKDWWGNTWQIATRMKARR